MSNHEHDEKESVISELSERMLNGIIKENPTFVLLLGMCPTLAVTTSAINGLGMGATTMVVLALSNLMISALRKVIPNKIRIPAFIVIIASFVTIVELLLEAFIPSLYDSLGLYIPLIVVNCIILGRAEAYAYSHRPLPSLFDGFGMGMGFTFALTIIGSFREILGAGTVFSKTVMPSGYVPVSIFIMAPGAFFVLAALTAIQNKIKEIGEKKGKDMSKIQSGCGGNCMECTSECSDLKKRDEMTHSASTEAGSTVTVKEELKNEAKESTTSSKVKEETKESIVNADSSASGDFLIEVPKKDISKKKTQNEDASEKGKDKKEELKKEASRKDTFQKEVARKEVSKQEIQKIDELKGDEPKKERTKKAAVQKEEPVKEETAEGDKDFEVLDLSDYKNIVKKVNSTGKKPVRKKSSIQKAQAMLEKAEETLKEEENND